MSSVPCRAALFFLVCSAMGGACGKTKVLAVAESDAGSGGGADVVPPPAEDAATAPSPDAISSEGCPAVPAARPAGTPTWSSVSSLRNPQSWYATPPAAYIAENLLYYQNGNGGWPKNIDMSYRFGVDTIGVRKDPKSMIDNGATTTQVRFMAYALGSWPTCQRFASAFNAGMGFLFNAQYASNGGWPQVWPIEPSDYSRRITYNDDAMVHVMQILRDIVYGDPLFQFASADTRARATTALSRGVDCMLKTQIVSGGVKTGWCAQHDEVTLLPANARAYELASESGKEGAQVLAFLMTLDLARADVPRQEVIDAVEAAVRFYDSVKILGYRYVQGASDAGASDSWIEVAPDAPPLWARFYNLDTPFTPFFCDRDGVKVYNLTEVGVERRGGYTWYVTDPSSILGMRYPAWVGKWMIGRNVLGGPIVVPDGGGAAGDGGGAAD